MRIAVLLVCLVLPIAAQATLYVENPDAGESLASSQLLPDGTTSVSGFVGSADADLFQIVWGGGLFDVNSFATAFDTVLSLFDDAGYGVLLNDDTGGGLQSSLSTSLGAGTYYLGISGFPYAPVSSSGLIWLDGPVPHGQPPNGPGAADPLSGWNNAGAQSGNYILDFRAPISSVPLPGSIVLIGLGLVALARCRRKS